MSLPNASVLSTAAQTRWVVAVVVIVVVVKVGASGVPAALTALTALLATLVGELRTATRESEIASSGPCTTAGPERSGPCGD